MLSLLNVLDIVLCIVTVYLVKNLLAKSRRQPLPPGPEPLPLIGNVLDMPRALQWKTFTDWREKYGDIIYLRVLGQPIVVLNSIEDAVNLLDKRSGIYSDRPILWMAGELIGWTKTLVMTKYGDAFRDIRKLFHQYMGSRDRLRDSLPIVQQETHRSLKRIVTEPNTPIHDHVRRNAGAIILKMAYNYEVQEGLDPFVKLADDAMTSFNASSQPGAYLVDIFPLMRFIPAWLPGAGWKRDALKWRKNLDDVFDIPFQLVKDQMESGVAESSFVSRYIDAATTPTSQYRLKIAAASLYTGGADTTVSAITGFFLAMTLYPEVQKKAQAEIDAVIGPDRLPTLQDQERLPYISALCSEVLRWNPVTPLAVPHTLSQDDTYKGYHFEKGTIFMPNVWGLLHDPARYADPLEFKPERFLPDGKKAPEPDPRFACFGFGRRICPGLHPADASVFVSCAMSIAVFNISKVVKNGVEVTPSTEFTTGTISHPPEFQCSITPRSAKAEALIFSVDNN